MAAEVSFFNEERKEELQTAFDLKATDGKLTTTELGPLLRSMGLDPSTKEVIEYETEADPTGSGTIEFDALLKVLEERCGVPFDANKLDKAFKLMLNPQTKNVPKDELAHYLKSYNPECNDENIAEFLSKIPCSGENVNVDRLVKELTS